MFTHVRAGLAALLLLLALPAAAQDRACRDVRCSGHGTCFPERGVPQCLCDAGFSAVGTACAPAEGEDEALRARRDPRAGARVVELAVAEVGHRPGEVGQTLDRHPYALSSHLAPFEWWCGDFVAWAYEAAGVGLTGGSSGGWHVGNNRAIRAWFEQRGQWIGRGSDRWQTYEPQPGDYVRFDTENGGHAAIVHHASGDTLYTVEGNLSSHVELARYYHFRNIRFLDGIGVLALPNARPRVDAGEDAVVTSPSALRLRGAAEDDGPAERLGVAWTKVRGPGELECDDAAAPEAECTFSRLGSYTLRLFATDGEHDASDEVVVEVRGNRAPRVTARVLSIDAERRTAELRATIDDEAEPSIAWSVVSGPGDVTFGDGASLATRATFSGPGAYVLRLAADDGEHVVTRDVRVELAESPLFGCAIAARRAGVPWPLVLAIAVIARLRVGRRLSHDHGARGTPSGAVHRSLDTGDGKPRLDSSAAPLGRAREGARQPTQPRKSSAPGASPSRSISTRSLGSTGSASTRCARTHETPSRSRCAPR